MVDHQDSRPWIRYAFLLYLPFLVEFLAYPLFMKIQPSWLGGMLFFLLYTYPAYGVGIYAYRTWRKRIGDPISFGFHTTHWMPVMISALLAIVYRRCELLITGHSLLPMLYTESTAYLSWSPVYMGAGALMLQWVYYALEFSLAACIIDCAQHAMEKRGACKKIPWGGLFLGLTWGIGHAITKGNAVAGAASFVLSLLIGTLYVLFEKKPIIPLIAIACAYLL